MVYGVVASSERYGDVEYTPCFGKYTGAVRAVGVIYRLRRDNVTQAHLPVSSLLSAGLHIQPGKIGN